VREPTRDGRVRVARKQLRLRHVTPGLMPLLLGNAGPLDHRGPFADIGG
jgi:hypothetical protein